jgi:hypothetical protein
MTADVRRSTLSAPHRLEEKAVSPLELRALLSQLRLELIAATQCGLSRCPAYMADLEAEEAECLEALTLATVTEIAMLRRELWGPLVG